MAKAPGMQFASFLAGAGAGAEGQGPPRSLATQMPGLPLSQLPLLWTAHPTEATGRRLIRIGTAAAADKLLKVPANRNLQPNSQGPSAYECRQGECTSTRGPLNGAPFPPLPPPHSHPTLETFLILFPKGEQVTRSLLKAHTCSLLHPSCLL